MAEQKSEKPYFADVYNATYIFHKKWSGDKYTDAEWSQIVKEADAIWKKLCSSGENVFGTDILVATLSEIERHNLKSNGFPGGQKAWLTNRLKEAYGVETNEELAKKLLEGGG